ncbi:type II toxin-antitoxin system HicB family antitoxin [Tistrella mobilis]|jgi:predicted RNase H-like HicB family nuclease|uniref:type II toxin-antitoxin system HicB family antitoxin n=1 Tax=Tistrella mobilis TaxID=171437 RepID=UPI003556EB0F
MQYPVLIENGSETTAFGVVFPDLPGCFSAGDTLEAALLAAREAAAAWIDAAVEAGTAIPAPSGPGDVRNLPDGNVWMLHLIDLDRPDDGA